MLKTLRLIGIYSLLAGIISGCSSINKENAQIENKARMIFFSRPAKSDEKIPVIYKKTIDIDNKTYVITILDYKNYKKDELMITKIIRDDTKETHTTIRDLERFGSPNYGVVEVHQNGPENLFGISAQTYLFYDLEQLGTFGEEYRKEYEQIYQSMLEEIVAFREKKW